MTPANNESMKSWTSVGHLSKSESEALQYLVSQGSISTSELAEHMELGVSRARALLKSLVEDGFAQSRGRGRATRYEPSRGAARLLTQESLRREWFEQLVWRPRQMHKV